jgi:hypothetical protein
MNWERRRSLSSVLSRHLPEGSLIGVCSITSPTKAPKQFSYESVLLTYIRECKRGNSFLFGGRGQLKCDDTRAETRFLLSAKRTSPFKSAGASVQSTTGSRGVRIRGSNAGYNKLRGSVKSTGSIRQFPLHFPSSASPCAITFQLESTLSLWLLLLSPGQRNQSEQKSAHREMGNDTRTSLRELLNKKQDCRIHN